MQLPILATILSVSHLTLAQSTPFSVITARSASPIHLQPFAASGGKIWVGKATASYCPPQVTDCPAGTSTSFVMASGSTTLSLNVEVPGGQQCYIAPDGSLSFTAPHSAYIPPGSITTGFVKTEGASYGTLSWTPGGLVACPQTSGGYLIVGVRKGVSTTGCLGFDGLTSNGTKGVYGAWEYT